jgi:hypothetical protein
MGLSVDYEEQSEYIVGLYRAPPVALMQCLTTLRLDLAVTNSLSRSYRSTVGVGVRANCVSRSGKRPIVALRRMTATTKLLRGLN